MHLPLITTIAGAFTVAWALGLVTERLRLSSIVGYLLAGVFLGPFTPGFVVDSEIAHQLAELGVILLMFGVGLHFQIKDLLAVKSVAIPGAIGQSVAATLLSIAAFTAFGMPVQSAAVIGAAISVASTVVLMRVLMDADALDSPQGHVAVGWLLVEDVFTVIVLVLIPLFEADVEPQQAATAASVWLTVGLALLKIAVLVAILLFAGSRAIPWVLVQVARLRSRELFTLTVLVFSIAIATAAYYIFGASMALGAFLAGMVVGQSPVSHQAAADALPLRDAFAVLFFVSVGMLLNPAFLLEEPWMVVTALLIILVGKPLAALAIVALLGHSARTALTVAVGLAQIGEFSFILSQLATQHGLMPESGQHVIVASAIISLSLNPLLFRSLDSIERALRTRHFLWSMLTIRSERRAAGLNAAASTDIRHNAAAGNRVAIVVGYGPVGRAVHRLLKEAGLTTVIVELNIDTVSELNAQGQTAIFGDAARQSILEQAGACDASYLILTLPHSTERAAVVSVARNLNESLRILVRARYLAERESLEQAGATAAVFEEAEAAVGLARLVLADTGADRALVERSVRDLRLALLRENVSTLKNQSVRSIMVPWTRVARLSSASSFDEVRNQVAAQPFSRWPVIDAQSGRPVGQISVKQLIAEGANDGDWTRLVRPIQTLQSDDDVQTALARLQEARANMCVVEEAGTPVGVITLEDLLEQAVGRVKEQYPHNPGALLAEALTAGNAVLELTGRTAEHAIRELAAAIPQQSLASSHNVAELALARERDVSTDLGVGVASPHARVAKLAFPLIIFGRSSEGVIFSPRSPELVKWVFLLVTPLERPDLQLFLLGELARVALDSSARERLTKATSIAEVINIVNRPQG